MRVAVAIAVLVLAVFLSSCSKSTPLSYVALGDSYASGPRIPVQHGPGGCRRSDHNYPSFLAVALHADRFVDVSCNGATTQAMTLAQPTGPNLPQADSLDAATNLVTLSVGGNDIGFSELAIGCTSIVRTGSPCQNLEVADGVDRVAIAIEALRTPLGEALREIRRRAPKARVFVVGYPTIFPTAAGCWPRLAFANADLAYLRGAEIALNAVLKSAASAAHDTYVDTMTPSFGHDACEPESVRWVEPDIPGSAATPLHPNRAGMAALAQIIAAGVKSG